MGLMRFFKGAGEKLFGKPEVKAAESQVAAAPTPEAVAVGVRLPLPLHVGGLRI